MFHSSWRTGGLEAPSQLCEGNDTTFSCCQLHLQQMEAHARKWIYTICRRGILHHPPCGFILGWKLLWLDHWTVPDAAAENIWWNDLWTWNYRQYTLAKYVHTLPHCVPICDELEQFTEYTLVDQSNIETYGKEPGQETIKIDGCRYIHHLLDMKLIAWSICQVASSMTYLLIVIKLYKLS